MKEDIKEAWNEAEELNTSLRELTDEELIECRDALIKRTERIMSALNEHVSEDEV